MIRATIREGAKPLEDLLAETLTLGRAAGIGEVLWHLADEYFLLLVVGVVFVGVVCHAIFSGFLVQKVVFKVGPGRQKDVTVTQTAGK